MEVAKVLAGIAVSDLEQAKRWYEVLFGRRFDAEPMPGCTEWHTDGGIVQLIVDEQRTGGALVTLGVPDARASVKETAVLLSPRMRKAPQQGGASLVVVVPRLTMASQPPLSRATALRPAT